MARIASRLAVMLAASVLALPIGAAAQVAGGNPQQQKSSGQTHVRGGGGGQPHVAPHPQVRAAPQVHVAPHPVVRAAPHPQIHVAPRPTVRAAPRHVPTVSRSVQHNAPVINRSVQSAAPATTRSVQQRQIREHRRAVTTQPQAQPNVVQQGQRNRGVVNGARRLTTQPTVQPNAAVQRNVTTQGAAVGTRRNRHPHVAPDVARRGRFGSVFASAPNSRNIAQAYVAPRRAWRRGHRARFVPWYGPVFWPYAYSDIFDYTFWPDAYDDSYWFYAYDDFFDGVFWGEAGPPQDYTYASPPAPQPRYAAVQELCKQPGTGITAWPFAEMESKLGLNAEQKRLIGDLRAAASKAQNVFKASCPSDSAFPLTPPGRLQAMTARLQATLEAVRTVRPALEAFYNSLSDEQKERFNELGPKKPAVSAEAKQALPQEAKACSEAKPGLTNLPIDEIENTVKPDDNQQADLDRLGEATVKAVGILQAACPQDTPITPTGRLEAIETRLKAMIEAANMVKEPLDSFFASLSNEQKARFNRMGRELANTSG